MASRAEEKDGALVAGSAPLEHTDGELGSEAKGRDGDELVGEESCSEKKFFDEREQVAQLLQELLDAEFATHESDVDAAFSQRFKTITSIVRVCMRILYCACVRDRSGD